jgi:Fe-S cluster biosynthesis and repair protein YggX
MLWDMELDDRIAQWEQMTREAPDDMAWFSLGTAYKDAGRLAESEAALAKALELNANLSRAYQLRGQVLLQLDRHEEAGRVLTEGYRVAAGRGDVMPQKAMGSLLEKQGLPVPQIEAVTPAAASTSGDTVIDRRTGGPGTRMPAPPMRGALGTYIHHHYSQETWSQWIAQGTKVINEMRLDFSNAAHQRAYDQQMLDWLGITEEEVQAYAQQNPS